MFLNNISSLFDATVGSHCGKKTKILHFTKVSNLKTQFLLKTTQANVVFVTGRPTEVTSLVFLIITKT